MLKTLRRLDPEYRKEFARGAKAIVAPMIADARGNYPEMPISGMARAWATGSGFAVLPWQVAKVRSGVKLKTSTRKTAESVLYVSQTNPAGVLFETVSPGKPMGARIRARSGKVLWPAADRHAAEIRSGIERLVDDAAATVQKAMG